MWSVHTFVAGDATKLGDATSLGEAVHTTSGLAFAVRARMVLQK